MLLIFCLVLLHLEKLSLDPTLVVLLQKAEQRQLISDAFGCGVDIFGEQFDPDFLVCVCGFFGFEGENISNFTFETLPFLHNFYELFGQELFVLFLTL
jgi:hypothetical protein